VPRRRADLGKWGYPLLRPIIVEVIRLGSGQLGSQFELRNREMEHRDKFAPKFAGTGPGA
jgi:hypothetical protein